ncbi:MAG: 30S ribosomal protein S6 [Flavobacteriaceae bacterium]|jgi:small subunit ribosomal protein S6|nr:30S ribosomal protein S6 [Flavobacteriaceae bacterium]
MNHYETVFILTPVLSDSQVEEAVKHFESLLKENKATIVNQENWGLKKLAYSIQLKRNGFYSLIEFEAPGEVVNTLEVTFKRDERVLRFLTVKLDKHGIEWARKRQGKIKSEKK